MKSSFIKGRDKYFSKGRKYLKNEIKKNICRLNLEKYLNPVLPKQNFAQISLQVGSVSIYCGSGERCVPSESRSQRSLVRNLQLSIKLWLRHSVWLIRMYIPVLWWFRLVLILSTHCNRGGGEVAAEGWVFEFKSWHTLIVNQYVRVSGIVGDDHYKRMPRVIVGTPKNPHWSMAMNAEYRSKFAALRR